MATAVLLVNMPERCSECDLYSHHRRHCGRDNHAVGGNKKPNWCPLIPEPNRREPGDAVEFTEGEPLTDELADKIFNFGFNECLAVIEEMAEEGKENE